MDYAYHGDFVWVSVYFPHSNSRLDRLVLLHVTSFCTIVLFTNKTQFQYFHGTSFVVLVFSKKTVHLREYHFEICHTGFQNDLNLMQDSPVTAVSGRGCWSCFPPIGVLGNYGSVPEMSKSFWTCQSFGLILKILSVRTIKYAAEIFST